LVSLEERVHEALNFRRELNNLEKDEQDRVASIIEQKAWKSRKDLNIKHDKEKSQLQIKLQEMEFKLIIQMKK